MSQLLPNLDWLPAMSCDAVASVSALESVLGALPQVDLKMQHALHAKTYVRAVDVPAGVLLTGALIKIPTTLYIHGHVTIYTGDGAMEVRGSKLIYAAAGRKQTYFAHADTQIVMAFATHAETLEAAEAEFTDEVELLMSRNINNNER